MGDEWLSYREAAERLGVSAENVRHRAIRGRWPRTRGNDGKAKIQLPEQGPNPVRTPGERPKQPGVRTPSEQGANPQTIKALEAHVATLLSQLAATEARLSEAGDRETRLVADLAGERARTGLAIETFRALADKLDALAAATQRRPWWRRLAG
jgi:DNA primase